jgi:hypothetical protein
VNQQESAAFFNDLRRAEEENRMVRDAMADAKLAQEEDHQAGRQNRPSSRERAGSGRSVSSLSSPRSSD